MCGCQKSIMQLTVIPISLLHSLINLSIKSSHKQIHSELYLLFFTLSEIKFCFSPCLNQLNNNYISTCELYGLTIEDAPYSPSRSGEWSSDVRLWPQIEYGDIFSYFITRPGTFTLQQLASWRQLEAYSYFKNNYVQSIFTSSCDSGIQVCGPGPRSTPARDACSFGQVFIHTCTQTSMHCCNNQLLQYVNYQHAHCQLLLWDLDKKGKNYLLVHAALKFTQNSVSFCQLLKFHIFLLYRNHKQLLYLHMTRHHMEGDPLIGASSFY